MATVAIVWELGADLGHISRLLPIAQHLNQIGHHPILILKDLKHCEDIFLLNGIDHLKAPAFHGKPTSSPPAKNFTETLLNIGYSDKEQLSRILDQWLRIYETIKPDIILFDHAPTAMLAARKLNCPKIQIGNSFTVLPKVSPFPNYKFWGTRNTHEERQVKRSDSICLNNINYALNRFMIPNINSASEIYSSDHTFIDTHPLLDVYGERKNVEYLGVYKRDNIGVQPIWPDNNLPKIFVYIKSRYKGFEPLMRAIKESGAQFLSCIPDISDQDLEKYNSKLLKISRQPFHINSIINSCDALINHASSIADIGVQVKKPQLFLPLQMEQLMRAKRLLPFNGSLATTPNISTSPYLKSIRDLIGKTSTPYETFKVEIGQSDMGIDKITQTIEKLLIQNNNKRSFNSERHSKTT